MEAACENRPTYQENVDSYVDEKLLQTFDSFLCLPNLDGKCVKMYLLLKHLVLADKYKV